MRTFGRVVGFLLAVVAIPLFTMASCNLAVESTMLNPDTYKGAFEDQAVFDDLLPLAFPTIFAQGDDIDQSDFPVDLQQVTSVLDTEGWRAVLGELVPASWLQARYDQFVDAWVGALRGDFSQLESDVDFSEIRDRLTGPEAQQAADALLSAVPDCSLAESRRIRDIANGAEELLPVCEPTILGQRITSMTILTEWFNALGRELPAEPIPFNVLFDVQPDDARVINLLFELDQSALLLFFLCPVALLSLIVIVAVRSLRGFGMWAGSISVGTAFTILISLVVFQTFILGTVSTFFDRAEEADLFVRQIVIGLVRSVVLQSTGVMFVEALIFGVIGAALLLIAMLAPVPDFGRFSENTVFLTDDGQVISTASLARQSSSATIRLDNTETR